MIQLCIAIHHISRPFSSSTSQFKFGAINCPVRSTPNNKITRQACEIVNPGRTVFQNFTVTTDILATAATLTHWILCRGKHQLNPNFGPFMALKAGSILHNLILIRRGLMFVQWLMFAKIQRYIYNLFYDEQSRGVLGSQALCIKYICFRIQSSCRSFSFTQSTDI